MIAAPFGKRVIFGLSLFQLLPANSHAALTASFTVSSNNAEPGQTLTFNASAIFEDNPENEIVQFLWTMGDGTSLVGAIVNYAYSAPGRYLARLFIADDLGETAQASQTIVIGDPGPVDPPENTAPVVGTGGPYLVQEGEPLRLDASSSYDPDTADGDAIVSYAWDLNFNGSIDVTSASPIIETSYFSQFEAGQQFRVALVVTDRRGARSIDRTTVTIADTEVIPEPTSFCLFGLTTLLFAFTRKR